MNLDSRTVRRLMLMTLVVSFACERAPVAEPPLPQAATPAAAVEISSTPPAPLVPEAPTTPSRESEEAAAAPDAPESDLPEPPPPMPFGVPECDTFVTKFLACVEVRVPADQQPRLLADLQENRAKWRQLATMSQGHVALGLACRTMAQRVKSDLIVDYGCEF
ncbi:MAG: hypothetical protein KA385_17885 [Vicinamibacteria bacterium]|nr:hypothetical protein [Vicinamibacteria bacterium]